ncbi:MULTISPECIES: lipoprotein [Lonsdalea]|uniref:Uncharacterized protein n=3 Tax=Lonsdalea TaxID=1082702 RepID=A0ACD1JCN1_9GAMM|nr:MULTISPECIES: lipoprotein [Lonsdalea]OSM98046.1 hypothetical protein AU508_04360 [Lonsdalea populi]RAT13601.1 hypothetical protein AU485_08390 [Lonsdalea quercina]RAT17593.1 hypothetical protein AU486_03930 [Lonsdalea quercina]RAT20052.1 hypothetical protein AU487_09345 [Lonsdalea populi]RAT24224.1 hypothetical protein AU489_09675 [Lonsdalea populi]
MLKKFIFPLLAVMALAGCAGKGNTLNINPNIALPSQDPSLMGVTISINGADQRQDQALAKVNRDSQLVTLVPSRDLRFLLQEALEKQMTARGYMIGTGGPVALQIVVNTLYADVSEGNLRYTITTKADISIIAQASNGNKQVKNYRSTYNVQGALTATNNKITTAVNQVLSDVISDMAQDTSVNEFIKTNAR